MRAVILYASTHHGNTKKVVEAVAECISADIVDVTKNKDVNLLKYDMVGFASGAYFGTFHQSIKKFIAEAKLGSGQKVFLLCTCGVGYRDYSKETKDLLAAKGAVCLGSFQCRGYDTFGIFGKIGGIAKKHPNAADLENARKFIRQIT